MRPSTVARGLAVGAALAVAARVGGPIAVTEFERRTNRLHHPPPYRASARAQELHRSLAVADLHADSLLWGRDLLRRSDVGHVDIPRLVEGNVGLQAFSACVKVPRGLNLERNDGRHDDVTLLALALGWPPRTWRSPLARALYFADRLRAMAERSAGLLTIVASKADLAGHLERRSADPARTAGLLTIEGAYVLEGETENVDRLADAGFRMMSPTHFIDNEFGGSAHGVDKGPLTWRGRDMVRRMEERGMLVDVAHASLPTIDDILAMARAPVVASHTGVRGTCDNLRNLSDAHLRAIAATGGLAGIGFWPAACGGRDVAWIARSVSHAVAVAGIEHVGLGSDFDGAVPVPFDATGLVQLTGALLAEGFGDEEVRAIMGGNVFRLLAENLPDR
jgi:microsomal dipeptidase-like Zn-dependent dipeptidase